MFLNAEVRLFDVDTCRVPGGGGGLVTLTPPRPPDPLSFPVAHQSAPATYARRPRVWVPPVIVTGAFSAGYAIPWSWPGVPPAVVAITVVPLVAMAAMCVVAGFMAYRTRQHWRAWTAAAAAVAALATVDSFVTSAFAAPLLVLLLMCASAVAITACAVFGAEPFSEVHRMPALPAPTVPGFGGG